MLDSTRTLMIPAAQCTGCGNLYAGVSLLFLYTDERGAYCHDCGGILAEDPRLPEEASCPHRLVLPEGLEGSELHKDLEKLAQGEQLRVLVDSSSGARAIYPEPCWKGRSPLTAGRR